MLQSNHSTTSPTVPAPRRAPSATSKASSKPSTKNNGVRANLSPHRKRNLFLRKRRETAHAVSLRRGHAHRVAAGFRPSEDSLEWKRDARRGRRAPRAEMVRQEPGAFQRRQLRAIALFHEAGPSGVPLRGIQYGLRPL